MVENTSLGLAGAGLHLQPDPMSLIQPVGLKGWTSSEGDGFGL